MANSMTLAILLSAKDQASAVLKNVQGQTDKLGTSILKHHKAIGIGMTAIGGAITGVGILSIQAASGVEEMTAKFDTVFKDSADDVKEWAAVTASAMGRSRFEFMDMASSVQDTFVPMGFARDKAAEMSKQLTELAVDVASFNNKLDKDVMRDFQSALVGNTETVRKYGIVITESRLQQEIMNSGWVTSVSEITEAMKVQARMNMILQGTTDAQGDAIRTGESFANQMKKMKAGVEEIQVSLGQALLPAVTSIISKVTDIIGKIKEWRDAHPDLVNVLDKVVIGIGALLLVLGPLVIMLPGIISALPLIAGGFSLLLGPVGLVAAAVIALGAAFIYFKNKADAAKQAIIDVDQALLNSEGFEFWPAGMTEAEKAAVRAKHAADNLNASIAELTPIVEADYNAFFKLSNAMKAEEAMLKLYYDDWQSVGKAIYDVTGAMAGWAEAEWDAIDAQTASMKLENERIKLYNSLIDVVGDYDKIELEAMRFKEEANRRELQRVGDLKRAYDTLRQTWDSFLETISPAARLWDKIGASGRDAFDVLVRMSGKTEKAIVGLFTEAGYAVSDWAEKWAEMVKAAGVDGNQFAIALEAALSTTKIIAKDTQGIIEDIGSTFKQTGDFIMTETGRILGFANVVRARMFEALGYGFGGLMAPGGYATAPPPPSGGGQPTPTSEAERYALWSSTIGTHQMTDFEAWKRSHGWAKGGIIPGPIGQPQLAMVHGGETITPPGRGGGVTVNINGGTFLGNESEARKFAEKISKYLRSNQIAQFGTVRA